MTLNTRQAGTQRIHNATVYFPQAQKPLAWRTSVYKGKVGTCEKSKPKQG